MKFYKEVSKNSVTKLFEELDKLKSYMLEDKDIEDKDTCASLIAVNEYFYRRILNQINNILIDTTSKNEELIKD